ncbi:hypothetical protein PDE_01469 [Penicillium oxalicum 114-2]|uniref:Uncharacterized protein n=1 Tax=Penicillium oxalicum (strain 114-2 / CGMCC 5302) TaxID=933388 RepID=S8AX86_PENO1|nr:hypothetical protein PDE_01469 [Penicillium oxalicum 114-2]
MRQIRARYKKQGIGRALRRTLPTPRSYPTKPRKERDGP